MDKQNPFDFMIERAKSKSDKTLVFPEGEDLRIVEAVRMLAENKSCKVVVLCKEEEVKQKYNNEVFNCVTFIDTSKDSETKSKYAQELYEIRKSKGLTIEQANELVSVPIYYGSMMVKLGDADGMVAGAVLHSADVMRPVFQIIKQRKDIVKASSCFVMEVPNGKPFGENGFMIFADCAVNQYPNAEELASIALASRDSAKNLCGMTPKIAMLSYSTGSNGSTDETIVKIKKAIEIFKENDSETIIDGEMQSDTGRHWP